MNLHSVLSHYLKEDFIILHSIRQLCITNFDVYQLAIFDVKNISQI